MSHGINTFLIQKHRSAFSLIELIVLMAILGLLAALVLTAVQSARESARRTACQSNLHQLGVAIEAFEGVNGHLPAGASVRNFSLHVQLLPYVEQTGMHAQILGNADEDGHSSRFRTTLVPVFVCPSDGGALLYSAADVDGAESAASWAPTSYSGNYGSGFQKHGYNGAFAYAAIESGSFSDGRANTAAMSEVLVGDGTEDPLRISWKTIEPLTAPAELDVFAAKCIDPDFRVPTLLKYQRGRPWTEGQVVTTLYNHVITPNQPFCANGGFALEGAYPPSSNHNAAVNVLFGDGRVDFVSEKIALEVWRKMGSRNGDGPHS